MRIGEGIGRVGKGDGIGKDENKVRNMNEW